MMIFKPMTEYAWSAALCSAVRLVFNCLVATIRSPVGLALLLFVAVEDWPSRCAVIILYFITLSDFALPLPKTLLFRIGLWIKCQLTWPSKQACIALSTPVDPKLEAAADDLLFAMLQAGQISPRPSGANSCSDLGTTPSDGGKVSFMHFFLNIQLHAPNLQCHRLTFQANCCIWNKSNF